VDDWESGIGLALFPLVAVFAWLPWYLPIFRVNRFAAPRSQRIVLGVAPIVCLTFLVLCLEKLAAKAVRESAVYGFSYTALGAAALGICSLLFPFFGVSARDDVLERRNPAALLAIVGALLGATLCFVGGNIGEGPGVEVVITSAGAALSSWFFLWYFADVLSGRRISDRITVERDPGSGVRLAGLLAGNGVILGAAAAGDWIPNRFLHDFALSAWPALPLTGIAGWRRTCRQTGRR